MTDQTAAEHIDEVRRRRAELRESIGEMESALAQAAHGREAEWTTLVRERSAQLEDDFAIHLEVAEAPNGLHTQVLADAPYLAPQVNRLQRDHAAITKQFAEVHGLLDAPEGAVDVDAVRLSLTDLIGMLVRHRQRGADLLWDAYATSLGGET
jgi:hypothetical protein